MDPLLAAQRLPRLAEAAMRSAVVRALLEEKLTPRAIVDSALVAFEASVARRLGPVRPAMLFVERDRIARELRVFVDSRLARRLRAQPRAAIVAAGRGAAPFDIIVRTAARTNCAVVFRRLPCDGRRLGLLQRVRAAIQMATRTPVHGVLVYDFLRGRTVLLDQTGAQRVHRYLRAS